MRAKTRLKIWVSTLTALLLLAVFALPAFAASENRQAVTDQLNYLQQVQIDPEWPPDVRTNQSAVQRLLDLYLACSAAERKEFTTAQNTLLRAYFEMLYSVQGKDAALVDTIFAGTVAASSSSSGARTSSRAASSSSGARTSSRVASSSSGVRTSSRAASSSSGVRTSSRAGSSSSGARTSSQAASSSSGARTSSQAAASSSSALSSVAASSASASASVSSAPSALSAQVSSSPTASASASSSSAGAALTNSISGAGSFPMPLFSPQIPAGQGQFAFMGSPALGSGLLLLLGVLLLLVFFRYLGALRAAVRPRKRKKKHQEPELDEMELEYRRAPLKTTPPANQFNTVFLPSQHSENIDEIDPDALPGLPPPRARRSAPPPAAPADASAPVSPQERSIAAQQRPKSYRPNLPPSQIRPLGPGRTGRPPKRTFRQGDADDIDAIDD